jgi:hypothetical protein
LGDPAVIDPHLSDIEALSAAISLVRRHPERWREFQALVLERGWDEAARVCVFDCQWRALRLRWGEQPPCVAGTRGKGRASCLLRRMLRRGISRYHPRPLEAIAAARKGPRRQAHRGQGGCSMAHPCVTADVTQAHNEASTMSLRPLALTDDQMSQVLRSAEPLRPSARSAFLQDVAQALNGHELGDGFVQRVCRDVQRKYFDVPDLRNSGSSKYSWGVYS